MNMTCAVTGLEYQEHTVTFTLKEGTFSVDMVGVLGDNCTLEDENTVSGNWKDERAKDPDVLPTGTPVPQGDQEVSIPEVLSTPEPTVPPLADWTPAPAATEAPDQTTETPAASVKPNQTAPAASVKPDQTPQPPASTEATSTPQDNSSAKGTLVKDNNAVYRIINEKNKTAALVRFNNKTAKKAVIPAVVKGYRDGKKISYQITVVDPKAFAGCKNIKKIQIQSKRLQKIGKNAFQGIHRKAVFTLPSSCRKKYKKLFTAKTGYQKKTMKLKF